MNNKIIYSLSIIITFFLIGSTINIMSVEALHYESTCSDDVRLGSGAYIWSAQTKFDTTPIVGYEVDSALWCGKLWGKQGTPTSDINVYYVDDQTWTESSALSVFQGQSLTKYTRTLNATSGVSCLDVTALIDTTKNYTSFRMELSDREMGEPTMVGANEYNEIGTQTFENRRWIFYSTEYPPASKLVVDYSEITYNGLNLTIKNYNNTIINGWGVESRNDTDTKYISSYNSPSFIEYDLLTNGISDVTITHPLFKNITINDINVHDSMGILNYTLYTYRTQQWTLLGGGSTINGTMTISNTTHSYNFNLEPTVQVYTDELPMGDVTAIFFAPNFMSLTKQYTIDLDFEINTTINLINSGIVLKVWNEDSRESITMYQVLLTNQSVTKKLTVGKTSTFLFLDDSHSTGISGNNNINYTYAFGYNNGNFSLFHNIGSSSSMNVSIYDPITETFSVVYSRATSTGGNLTSYFNVSNEINRYGDYPLFRLQTEGTVSVYDISLNYPYTYNSLGHMTVNYTNFGITSGDTRFMVSSDIYPQRTYFASPTTYTQTELNVYLTNLCFYKSFSVLQSGTMQTEQISGALVTIYRQYDYSTEIIAQEMSNAVGTLSMCVQPAYPYSITASATDYNTVTANSQTFFNDGQLVSIYLSQSRFNLTYKSPFSGILHQLTPNGIYFSNGTSVQFVCQGYSANNSLISMKFNVNYTDIYSSDLDRLRKSDYPPSYNFTLSNITRINVLNTNLTSSTGGFLNYTAIDIGRYDMGCTIEFTTNEFGIVQYTILRTIFFYGDSNTHSIINIGKDTNISELFTKETFQLISLFITMIVSGFFVKYFGVKSGFIFLVILGFQLVLFTSWGMPITTFGIYITAILIWLAIVLMGIL